MKNTLPFWAERLIVFDTETTGVSPATARVISACIAVIDGSGLPVERYDWLINPGIPIPKAASEIHGITTATVQDSGVASAIGVSQIIAKIISFLETGLPLVVYNAPYDLTLLKNEALRHNLDFDETINPILDPLVIDRQLDKYRRGKRTLSEVAKHYGVVLETAHDAGADAIAAGQVLQKIAQKYKDHLPEDINDLHLKQVEWSLEQAQSFQEYIRRIKKSNFIVNGSWPVQ